MGGVTLRPETLHPHDPDEPLATPADHPRVPRRELSWRRAARAYILIMATTDFLVTLAVVTSLCVREYGLVDAVELGVLAAAGLVATTAAYHGYRRQHAVIGPEELRSILPVAGVLAVVSLVLQGLGILDVPHALVLEALVLTAVLTTLTRLLQRTVARRLRAEGRLTRRTLLVGPLPSLRPVFDALDDARCHGLTIVGVCAPEGPGEPPGTVLGSYDAVPRLVSELAVETVIVSADAMDATELRRLGWSLRNEPVELLVLPPLSDVLPRRLHLEPLAGTPLLSVAVAESRAQRLAKAVVDRTVGTVLLLLALPVILGAGAAVRLTSRGPAFFAQTRIGMQGRPFTIYKLRSMYLDAEERLAELRERNEGNGMLFKIREDPRVTPVGRTLRRFSIDELPQLWNVVRGDMSLVGPRPALPSEVAEYHPDMAQRLQVKPGLTGLWQVSGRSNLSAERSVRLDLRYADNWSVAMDLRILLRTARAVIRGDGAY